MESMQLKPDGITNLIEPRTITTLWRHPGERRDPTCRQECFLESHPSNVARVERSETRGFWRITREAPGFAVLYPGYAGSKVIQPRM